MKNTQYIYAVFIHFKIHLPNPEIIITNQVQIKLKLGYNFIKHSEHLFSAFREISPKKISMVLLKDLP